MTDSPVPRSHQLTQQRTVGATMLVALLVAALTAAPAFAQDYGLRPAPDTLTQSILIHPPIDATDSGFSLSTREHTYKSHLRLGDQLARDFGVKKLHDDGIARPYEPTSRGEANDDWYAWRRDVLAPFEATVVRVTEPDTTNVPGTMNRDAQPGFILFHDGTTTVVYAHVREITVEEGETVQPGQVVGRVGNNGNSRAPHVHIGAWVGPPSLAGSKTGATPLQIQVDLYAAERER
jgi:murein DD-endopeptidase MepM/ murein hydrolase activator NlpD